MKNFWLKRVLAVTLTTAMVLGGSISVQAAEVDPAAEGTESETSAEGVEAQAEADPAEVPEESDYVDKGEFSNGSYTLDSEGTLTISGEGMVYRIYTFENTDAVKKVVFSEGITGTWDTCSRWKNLEEAVLPDSMESIGGMAFQNCNSLKKINIPAKATVDFGAFAGCISLNSGTHGDLAWEIDGEGTLTVTGKGNTLYPLWDAERVTKVVCSGSMASLGNGAFSNSSNLAEITFPEGLTSIGYSAFSGCKNLERVNLPNSVTTIGGSAFSTCGKLTELKLPEGLSEIEDWTFRRSGLTKIEVPGSVSKICYQAFSQCTDLETVVLKDGVQTISWVAFLDSSLKDITIPASVTEIGEKAIGYQTEADSETLAAHLPTIHCYANTAAHKYAVDNGIPFELLSTSDGTGTTPGTTASAGLSPEIISSETAKIRNAAAGSSVTVSMGKATVVPKEMLEAAKGKDVTVILQMNGYTWSINGKNITGTDLKDINLEVTRNTSGIPADRLKQTAGDNPAEQISLTYNGEFGFVARLTLNVGSQYAGKTGNLYYYNQKGELEWQSAGTIGTDGRVTLKFTHASDYAIVITEAKSPATGQEGTEMAVLAVMLLSAAGAFVLYRKRKACSEI